MDKGEIIIGSAVAFLVVLVFGAPIIVCLEIPITPKQWEVHSLQKDIEILELQKEKQGLEKEVSND